MSVPHPHSPADELTLRLPRTEARRAELDQDEEWCELLRPDGVERIRFHDYDRIFEIPGLYERLFYDELECCSPTVVREMLAQGIRSEGADPTSLSVLDLGAGNGMVGEELRDLGVAEIVGVDILPEARMATERDRPGVYADYRVCDLTDPPAADDDALRALAPDCLTTVAALGFGDIPPEAFATAFDYLADDGWVALTIRDDFVTDEDPSGSRGSSSASTPRARSRSPPSDATGTGWPSAASRCTTTPTSRASAASWTRRGSPPRRSSTRRDPRARSVSSTSWRESTEPRAQPRSCGSSKSTTGPSGTTRVGLIDGCVT